MSLTKYSPWNWFAHDEDSHLKTDQNRKSQLPIESPFLTGYRDIDRFFEDRLKQFGLSQFPNQNLGLKQDNEKLRFVPSLRISSDAESYNIELEAPSLNEKDIELELKGNAFIIKGKKEDKSETKDKNFHRIETSYGEFQRTLSLPEDAIADDIKAKMKNGVLNILIPRQKNEEVENSRKISIE